MGISSVNDDVALDPRIRNLRDSMLDITVKNLCSDSLVCKTHNKSILGRVVLILVLDS